jgi:hypothetical protein
MFRSPFALLRYPQELSQEVSRHWLGHQVVDEWSDHRQQLKLRKLIQLQQDGVHK